MHYGTSSYYSLGRIHPRDRLREPYRRDRPRPIVFPGGAIPLPVPTPCPYRPGGVDAGDAFRAAGQEDGARWPLLPDAGATYPARGDDAATRPATVDQGGDVRPARPPCC